MRRVIVFFVFVSITIRLFAQSDFLYTGKGEREYLKIRKDKIILKAKSVAEAKLLTKQIAFRSAYDVDYDMVIATIDTLQINIDDLTKIPS